MANQLLAVLGFVEFRFLVHMLHAVGPLTSEFSLTLRGTKTLSRRTAEAIPLCAQLDFNHNYEAFRLPDLIPLHLERNSYCFFNWSIFAPPAFGGRLSPLTCPRQC